MSGNLKPHLHGDVNENRSRVEACRPIRRCILMRGRIAMPAGRFSGLPGRLFSPGPAAGKERRRQERKERTGRYRVSIFAPAVFGLPAFAPAGIAPIAFSGRPPDPGERKGFPVAGVRFPEGDAGRHGCGPFLFQRVCLTGWRCGVVFRAGFSVGGQAFCGVFSGKPGQGSGLILLFVMFFCHCSRCCA